ncbi:MAG: 1-acyl-sn-glycerol-3-phosphate acyltransferase [Candidatus Cloacimonetes bacterium]|nr:1-acyl-sn-glycerol-3-phosphate acyltransferase [Candidatus Cloacimonadota bacterium]
MFLRILIHDKSFRTITLAESVHATSKRLVKTFGLELHVINPELIEQLKRRNHLFVANHITYLDILVLASLYPMNFITSTEMKDHPILGKLTEFGGSLYTNRSSIKSLPQEVELVAEFLRNGFNLGLFPEGTSFDGEVMRPFRNSLFQSAIEAGVPIQPICLRYTKINDKSIDNEDRRKIAWINNEPFHSHLKRVLKYNSISIDITILPEILPDESNRKILAAKVWDLINQAYIR